MEKNEFLVGMSILDESNLVNTVHFDKKMASFWYQYFKNHNYGNFIVTIMRYISKNKFYPTISDLLSGLKEVVYYNSLLMPPEKAWDDLEKGNGNVLSHKILRETGISIGFDGNLVINDEGARRRFIINYKAHVGIEKKKGNVSEVRDTVDLVKSIGISNVKGLADTKKVLIKEKHETNK